MPPALLPGPLLLLHFHLLFVLVLMLAQISPSSSTSTTTATRTTTTTTTTTTKTTTATDNLLSSSPSSPSSTTFTSTSSSSSSSSAAASAKSSSIYLVSEDRKVRTVTINNNNKIDHYQKEVTEEKEEEEEEEVKRENSWSPLEMLNPYLSACDLEPTSGADLQGACSDVGGTWDTDLVDGLCRPCQHQQHERQHQQQPVFADDENNNKNNVTKTKKKNKSNHQCLFYLEKSHKEKVCSGSSEDARRLLANLRMRHCCEHTLLSALSSSSILFRTPMPAPARCHRLLDALLDLDKLAAKMSCKYAEVLARYDCQQNYSIAYTCHDCQEAYRQWVCSSLVPHFVSDPHPDPDHPDDDVERQRHRLRPCRSVCQAVEQRCPYLLPGDRAPAYPTQYAGEPTFLCLDPNIPETGEQREKSSYGEDECCYSYCADGVGGTCVQCPGASASASPNDTAVPVRCAAGTAPATSQTSAAASVSDHRRACVCACLTTVLTFLVLRTFLFNNCDCDLFLALVNCACAFVFFARTPLLLSSSFSPIIKTKLIKLKWRSCS